jgi:catechol 2,3-dioxygenase-like lactoylglutathione lyase family enzyme
MARLAYSVVLTHDIERLAAFYTAVLQTEPQWNGTYAEFSTGDASFTLWSVDAYAEIAGTAALPHLGTGAIMLEFEVLDVDAEYIRLQGLAEFKIDFIIAPTTMAWGNRAIYFRDSDANLLNLFSHAAPPQ